MACHGSVRAGRRLTARGDERPAAPDGGHAPLRPVQPRPPDLCRAEAGRHRAAVRAAVRPPALAQLQLAVRRAPGPAPRCDGVGFSGATGCGHRATNFFISGSRLGARSSFGGLVAAGPGRPGRRPASAGSRSGRPSPAGPPPCRGRPRCRPGPWSPPADRRRRAPRPPRCRPAPPSGRPAGRSGRPCAAGPRRRPSLRNCSMRGSSTSSRPWPSRMPPASGAVLLRQRDQHEALELGQPQRGLRRVVDGREGALGPGLAAALVAAFAAFADGRGRARAEAAGAVGLVGLARAGGEQERGAGGGPEFRAEAGHVGASGMGRTELNHGLLALASRSQQGQWTTPCC